MRKIVRIPGSSPYGFRLVGGDGNVVTVARVRKESKAEEAGLQEGDALLAINDISCQGLSYNSIFGLTEINGHELKLEILRGADVQSNWRTALTCLDSSVQRLSELNVNSLLKNKDKQYFGSFEPSQQQVFHLQEPKPKFKQSTLPRIDVVLDTNDASSFFTTPGMTTSHTSSIHVVRSQEDEKQSLPLLNSINFDQGRSFISTNPQTFYDKGRNESNVFYTSTDKPLTLQFKADAFKPSNFDSLNGQFSTGLVNHSPPNYQSFNVMDTSMNDKTSFGPAPRFSSTSNLIVTNKNTNMSTYDNEPQWREERNFGHTSWETPAQQPSVEHNLYAPLKTSFDHFSGNKTEFSENSLNNWKFLDESRIEQFVTPSNILKKFNIGNTNTSHNLDNHQESFSYKSSLQNTKNPDAWSPERTSAFQEPFSLSTDFSFRSGDQMGLRFPEQLKQESSYQPAPPPPPPPHFQASGIQNQQPIPGSPSEFNLTKYVGNLGLRDNEKQILKEKVQMAKDMAHSVLSPANKNSKGQKIFLKRRAHSEHWTIEGPDPREKPRSEPVNMSKLINSEQVNKSANTSVRTYPGIHFNQTPNLLPYQAGSQSYLDPVQPVKWSPFNSNPSPQISLGYCDL